MNAGEPTYNEAGEIPADGAGNIAGVAGAEVGNTLAWFEQRLAWLKAQALHLTAADPSQFFQGAISPRRMLRAASPRRLIDAISQSGARIGTKLWGGDVAGAETSETSDTRSTVTGAPLKDLLPSVDSMRSYWTARVDVLHKMLRRKPDL